MVTPIRFSILLPTRNRLELARDAIETVRRQSFGGWELVVADNCSEQDVASHVAALADPRIVYIRSDTPLPVTANWNRALAAASGDYVVMLGDDDGLVPGYFERLADAIHALGSPDFIYHGAYHFAFPGVLPGSPAGALTDVTYFQSILRDRTTPALLAREEAHAIAGAALDMRARYAFNMQHFAFRRGFIARMAEYGPFFQGPFPDFYAANIAMLAAERIGLVAEPMVIIGISPKSYGYYHFNRRETGGMDFLNANAGVEIPERLRQQLLPGTNMNTSWLVSVALIAPKLGDSADLKPNVARYRRLQIIHNLKNAALGEPAEASLGEIWPLLNWREKVFACGLRLFYAPSVLLPKGRFRTRWVAVADIVSRQYQYFSTKQRPRPVVGRYQTILDVFQGLCAERALSPENSAKNR